MAIHLQYNTKWFEFIKVQFDQEQSRLNGTLQDQLNEFVLPKD